MSLKINDRQKKKCPKEFQLVLDFFSFFFSFLSFLLKKKKKISSVTIAFLFSGSGELCVDWLFPVLRAVGLRDGRDPGGVSDGGVHGALRGVHVSEGGVEP